jgi:murein DD-endopeptidase MepM/ murein hydrolase activator NlpD
MRHAAACLVALTACATPLPLSQRPNPCQDRIHVDARSEGPLFWVEAHNDCHVPIEVTLELANLRNLRPARQPPVVALVAPGETNRILELYALDPDRPAGFRAMPQFRVGGDAHPDASVRYAFPFGGGEARRLSQGVDGSETHSGMHRFAFDFELPIGTPVLAARPGVVFQVVDGFGPGGRDQRSLERGNAVLVWHSDGTFAIYGHLRKGACAHEGQRVATGDLLGWSGNSGYTTGPHLHFEVGRLVGEATQELESMPILFEGDRVPELGTAYPAQARPVSPGGCG